MGTESTRKSEGSRSSSAGTPPATGRFVRVQGYAMLLVLVVLAAVFSLGSPRFLSFSNIQTVLSSAAVGGTLALGMTFVLILAGIDLSVGSAVTLTSVVLGFALNAWGLPLAIAIVCALLTGTAIGFVNGTLVVRAHVPAIIVTLGTMSIVQSIASFATRGAIISISDFPSITFLGQGRIGGVPVPAIILILLTIISHILLQSTTFGTYLRAIGGNRQATMLMGVNVAAFEVATYMLSGLMAGIAGLMQAGRLSMGSSQAGLGLELPAIAAAVLGGTSLFGGYGTIAGTFVGALIISVLFNGLILIGVPFFYQLLATGVVLILAVAFNEAIRERVR